MMVKEAISTSTPQFLETSFQLFGTQQIISMIKHPEGQKLQITVSSPACILPDPLINILSFYEDDCFKAMGFMVGPVVLNVTLPLHRKLPNSMLMNQAF